jgi:hypothetical protein
METLVIPKSAYSILRRLTGETRPDVALSLALKDLLRLRLASLRLTIHPGARPRLVEEGFPFLGFVIFPHRRRLKRRKGIHFRRRFVALWQAYQRGEIPLEQVSASVQGWVNHVRYGNTVGLRKAVLDNTVSMRAC